MVLYGVEIKYTISEERMVEIIDAKAVPRKCSMTSRNIR